MFDVFFFHFNFLITFLYTCPHPLEFLFKRKQKSRLRKNHISGLQNRKKVKVPSTAAKENSLVTSAAEPSLSPVLVPTVSGNVLVTICLMLFC